jgi:ubiquinone/menaquinone biosynthesis C-methylase UbiE
MRVIRAGACTYMPQWSRCAFRAAVRETVKTHVIGFRCVKPAKADDPNLASEKKHNNTFDEKDFDYSEALRQMISCGINRKPTPALQDYITQNVRQGETVADVASGIGFLTFCLSGIIGNEGKVYAVDIDKSVLDFVEAYSAKEGKNNISVIVSKPADTLLPADSCDKVFLYAVLTYIDKGISRGFLTSIHKGLKKGGKLVIQNDRDMKENSRYNLELLPSLGFKLVQKIEPKHKNPREGDILIFIFEKV